MKMMIMMIMVIMVMFFALIVLHQQNNHDHYHYPLSSSPAPALNKVSLPSIMMVMTRPPCTKATSILMRMMINGNDQANFILIIIIIPLACLHPPQRTHPP